MCSPPAAVRIVTSLRSAPMPMSEREMSLTTTASSPFSRSLARPCSTAPLPCSAANPTRVCPGRRPAASVLEHVRGRFELQAQMLAAGLLELAVGGRGGPEVGDGGGHQQHVAGGELPLARVGELGGGGDLVPCDPRGASQRDVGGDHRHLGAARVGGLRERQPHAPRGAITDEAHAVDRLAGTTGGDEYAQALPRVPGRWCGFRGAAGRIDGEQPLAELQQPRGVGEAAHPLLSLRREAAGVGLDHVHAAGAQRVEVGAHGGVFVHAVVHRGRHDDRAGGGERGARQQVVGEAAGELGDRVGGGGRDQVEVGVAHQLEVADRLVGRGLLAGERPARGVALELVDEHRRAAQRRERCAPHEATRGGRLHDPHRVTGARRKAHELERLVGGDPAAHPEQDSGHTGVSEGRGSAGKRWSAACPRTSTDNGT